MKILKYSCLLFCLALGLVGCASNTPYRKNLPVYPTADTNRPADLPAINPTNAFTIETNDNFKIGYVEFDDQGWLWSHSQWASVKNEIQDEASNSAQGLTIIVFVHGWKNNAAHDNGNIEMFRGVLTNLSHAIGPRRVFGVYVGWRGLSATSDYFPPLAEELSFYNRKAVAERIGNQGAATQVFTELQIMQQEFNQRTNVPRTELIIIGHSFGGQLVFSAISQILIERLLEATRYHKPIQSFGDLVILLNPAFESSLYNDLISLATSPDITYPTNQPPVLAVFTSESDWATGLAFPAGRFFSTWFEKTRPSEGTNEIWMFNVRKGETQDERRAIRETLGHDQDYITYDLNYTNYGTNLPAISRKTSALQDVLRANNAATDATELAPYVFPDSIDHTNFYACILQPRTNGAYTFKSGNPFLDVAVDKRIMNGHNDIANPVLLNFLRDFILFNRTNYLNMGMR